jgi:ATP-dependent DNA ligase
MAKKTQKASAKACFIETMDCLPVIKPPEGPDWTYEIKLDGYRLEAVKSQGKVTVYSRRRNVLNEKFSYIAESLKKLPDETVLDGEIVAVDKEGRSNFNLLQNFRSAELSIHYYAFDVLMHKGKLLLERPLAERREILTKILPRNAHVSLSAVGTSASQMLAFVKEHGLEGIVAKRADSIYEPGKRTGLWSKYRINLGQEFVVGGYTPGDPFDALIVGFYRGKDLLFAVACGPGSSQLRGAMCLQRSRCSRPRSVRLRTCPKRNPDGGAMG